MEPRDKNMKNNNLTLKYYPRSIPPEQMVTIRMCNVLTRSKIPFDVEYDPMWLIDKSLRKKMGCEGVKNSRFDIVVLNEDKTKIIGIVETKRKRGLIDTFDQITKYEQYGVPVFLCQGGKDLNFFKKWIKKLIRGKINISINQTKIINKDIRNIINGESEEVEITGSNSSTEPFIPTKNKPHPYVIKR